MKSILTILIMLFAFQISFGQSVQSVEVDAVKYFDENKRWFNEFTEHWFQFYDIPEEEIRNSIIQFEKISKDLKTTQSEWEGTYGNGGDTHGNYLHWSEKNGFILLVVNKCNGGPTKIARGRVIKTDTSIQLIPEKVITSTFEHGSHSSRANDYKEREFLLVKWQAKNYVIESDSITNFADYTAGLNPETSGIYDEGWYYSKVFQESKGTANELPIFPAGYEKYVKKPFKATITSIGKSFRRNKKPVSDESDEYLKDDVKNYEDSVTEVKLDLGKSSNISPNIFLRFISENENDYSMRGITITKVFDKYAIGEYVTDVPKKTCQKSDFETCEAEERRPLKIGSKVSTTGEW